MNCFTSIGARTAAGLLALALLTGCGRAAAPQVVTQAASDAPTAVASSATPAAASSEPSASASPVAPSAGVGDRLADFMRMTINNRLPADLTDDAVCQGVFGEAESVAQHLGLAAVSSYAHNDAYEKEEAVCELNPAEQSSDVFAFLGVWPYDPDETSELGEGQCGVSYHTEANLTYECRADSWSLGGWIVNPSTSSANGTHVKGSLQEIVGSTFEVFGDELAKYPTSFYVSPYSTIAPLDSDGSDDPSSDWERPEVCEEGNPPFYAHLGLCVVPGIGPLRVLEACRGAAVADLWERSSGTYGRRLPDKAVQNMVETCVAGIGLKMTPEADVLGYPGESSTGLKYIVVKGGLFWDGEWNTARKLWDAASGSIIDHYSELEKVENWAG